MYCPPPSGLCSGVMRRIEQNVLWLVVVGAAVVACGQGSDAGSDAAATSASVPGSTAGGTGAIAGVGTSAPSDLGLGPGGTAAAAPGAMTPSVDSAGVSASSDSPAAAVPESQEQATDMPPSEQPQQETPPATDGMPSAEGEPDPSGDPVDESGAAEPTDDDATSAELPPGNTAPVVSELSVEANPNNVLSATVTWTTDVPGTSEVQFGIGEPEFRILSGEATTEHAVLVIGMHAQSDYLLRAVSSNTAGSGSAEGSFTTGTLPSGVPEAELTANVAEQSQSGWTLTNIMVGGAGGGFGSSSPAIAVAYDEAGEVVWYYVNGSAADTRGDISVDLTTRGNVLIGPAPGENPREVDLGGNVVWNGPNQVNGGDFMHHHAGELANGNYVVLRDSSSGGVTGVEIEEYTSDNQVAWSWDLLEHVTAPASASGDWCHGNSVTVDLDDDVVYLNCRFLGLFKIERGSGEVLWHMAGTLTSDVPGDFTYVGNGAQFSDAHDPEIHEDDGTILLYDNGGYAGVGGGGTNFHSRVLEYQVDQDGREATLVWEFPGDFAVDSWYTNDWYAAFWGDADRLANDNVLITAGLKGGDLQTRIFEVTRDGQIVWEIRLPTNQGSYRAERLSPPPLVERL